MWGDTGQMGAGPPPTGRSAPRGARGRLPHRLLLLSQLLLVAPHVVLEFCGQLLINCEEVLDFISVILHHLLEWTAASLSAPSRRTGSSPQPDHDSNTAGRMLRADGFRSVDPPAAWRRSPGGAPAAALASGAWRPPEHLRGAVGPRAVAASSPQQGSQLCGCRAVGPVSGIPAGGWQAGSTASWLDWARGAVHTGLLRMQLRLGAICASPHEVTEAVSTPGLRSKAGTQPLCHEEEATLPNYWRQGRSTWPNH